MVVSTKKVKVLSPESVANILKAMLSAEGEGAVLQEHFWSIGLNNKNVIQYIDLVSLGTLTESIVHPREVFRMAVKESCAALIVAHNHPSGVVTPSREDITTTDRLKEAGGILGIQITDHVIIGDSYYSMREAGFFS